MSSGRRGESVKRCERAAKFVVIEDPNASTPFCKDHGPENKLKKMGVLYRRARAGEKCCHDVEVDMSPVKSANAWRGGGGESKPFQPVKGGFPGSIRRQPGKIGEPYRIRPPKKK